MGNYILGILAIYILSIIAIFVLERSCASSKPYRVIMFIYFWWWSLFWFLYYWIRGIVRKVKKQKMEGE